MGSDWADYIVFILILAMSFLLPPGVITGVLTWVSKRLYRRSGGEIVFLILSGVAFLLTPLMEWISIFLQQFLISVCLDQRGLKEFLGEECWLFDVRELLRYAQFLWEFLGWLFVAWGLVIGWMIYKGVSLWVVEDRSVRSKAGLLLILLAWLVTGGGLVILFFTTVGG